MKNVAMRALSDVSRSHDVRGLRAQRDCEPLTLTTVTTIIQTYRPVAELFRMTVPRRLPSHLVLARLVTRAPPL